MATSLVGNRPFNFVDSNNRPIFDSVDYLAFRGEYDAGNNLIYKGFARPGSATSAAVWQIAKLDYDAGNNLTSITWATNSSGSVNADFGFVWDNRGSLVFA